SITVRERTAEMAVLKVLGLSRGRVLALVMGEGILVGALSGLIGAVLTYFLVNRVGGGLKIPIGFFPVLFIPLHALSWGRALGGFTLLWGGLVPAWNACSVKVSEVFSKVA